MREVSALDKPIPGWPAGVYFFTDIYAWVSTDDGRSWAKHKT